MEDFGTGKRLISNAARFAAGAGFTAFLLFGVALTQDAAAWQKNVSSAEWRAEWRKKWAAENHKTTQEAWREAWRKEWGKEALRAKRQTALKSRDAAVTAVPTAITAKPAVKADAKTIAPPIKPVAAAPSVPPKSGPKATGEAIPTAAVPPAAVTQKPASKRAAGVGGTSKNVSAPALPAPAASAAPPAAAASAVKSAVPSPAASPNAASGVSPAALPVPAPPINHLATPGASGNHMAGSPLAETRPDPAAETKKSADKPLDSPLSAVGDGGRMFFYLIPTVLVMVGALHLLRRFQEKKGRLPAFARLAGAQKISPTPAPKSGGILQALLGGMNRSKAPERASAIRIIESVPMGASQLHLIEVRGRSLLLGANANGVSLLTEVEESDDLVNNEFRLLLEQAAGDMDSLNLTENELPSSLLIGTLDEPLRDANRAVARGTRCLRTVQETEAACEQEEK